MTSEITGKVKLIATAKQVVEGRPRSHRRTPRPHRSQFRQAPQSGGQQRQLTARVGVTDIVVTDPRAEGKLVGRLRLGRHDGKTAITQLLHQLDTEDATEIAVASVALDIEQGTGRHTLLKEERQLGAGILGHRMPMGIG